MNYGKHNLRSVFGSHLMQMTFHNIIKNAKARDNSWDISADKYIEVYKKITK